MTLNRLQFFAAWMLGLMIILAFALQTPTAASTGEAARALRSPDPLFESVDASADSQAVQSILSTLAPEPPASDPAALGEAGELSISSLPEGDFSRLSVAAIVEERGVYSVYLRDADGVVKMHQGEVWHEWRITEIHPDRVYFESEENPFQFRVFAGIEGPS